MTYSMQEFKRDLQEQLKMGFDTHKLSQWAYELSIEKYREISPALDKIIQKIAIMSEGPEFEMTESELLELTEE